MAACEPIARSTLLTNFDQIPAAATDSLRTLIVGPDYAVRSHNTATAYNLVGVYDESTGVSSAWPNLGTGEAVDTSSAVVTVVNALANYYADTAVAPSAAQGSQSGTTPNAIVHNSGTTVFAGASFTPALGNAVAVGDYVKLDDNGGNTLETRVAAFGYTLGSPNILVLEDDLPAALAGSNFNVILAEIVPSYELATADTTVTATTVAADAAASIATDRTGSAVDLIGGQTYAGDDYTEVYVDYRALRDTTGRGMLTITSQDDLDTYFDGWSDPESGLGFAVARALAPATATSTVVPAVLAYSPLTADATGWQDAARYVQRNQSWMTVVPLTTNATYLGYYTSMVQARSGANISSQVFMALDLVTSEVLESGASNTVEVDQSLTPGEDRTVTRDGGVTAPFAAAVAGDTVQIAGVDYVIESVVSGQTVTITTAASAGAGQTLNNVVHPYSIAEQAADYGTRAQAYASQYVDVVFPPEPQWQSSTTYGYHLAAACAGLRGYTAPQQSLVGAQLESGWAVDQSAYDFYAYVSDLGTYGCFVVDQYDHLAKPNAVVLYGNTTDQSSTEVGRESVVANKAAARRYIYADLECMVSRAKVTPDLFGAIAAQITQSTSTLKSTSRLGLLGPVIVESTVGVIRQSDVSADTVVIPVTLVIYASLERLVTDITINLATVG